MAEYIEREAAKKEFNLNFGGVSHAVIANRILDALPAADVAPVVHGRWKPILEGVWNLPTPICVGWSCSLCGRYEQYKEPYCNCGARMDGE